MFDRELLKEMKQKKATDDNDVKIPSCKRRSFVTPL